MALSAGMVKGQNFFALQNLFGKKKITSGSVENFGAARSNSDGGNLSLTGVSARQTETIFSSLASDPLARIVEGTVGVVLAGPPPYLEGGASVATRRAARLATGCWELGGTQR